MQYFMWIIFIWVISDVCLSRDSTNICPNTKASISGLRKRRHLTFPDGYNVVLTISLVKAYLTHAPSGWNLSLEIDVMFPLPDANFTNTHFRRKLHHRQKREIWERIENGLNLYNINGRACILHSVCEAKKYLAPPGYSLVHDLIRAVFLAPLHEEDFRNEVKNYYNELFQPNVCEEIQDCPFSLLQMLLTLNKLNY